MVHSEVSRGEWMTIDEAKALLKSSGMVYDNDEDMPKGEQTLDMGDTWAWGTAWGEEIPDEELVHVAGLMWKYGRCGALYWMSERHNKMRSEFADINRFVEFVRMEEYVCKGIPDSNERAYHKTSYTIGNKETL